MKKILFLTLFATVSCGQKPATKSFNPGTTVFTHRTQDTKLDRSALNKSGVSTLTQTLYADNTENLLEISENLLDIAETAKTQEERQTFLGLSESVRNAFYSNTQNYTTFDHTSSTYLELALGLAMNPLPGDTSADLNAFIGAFLDDQYEKLSRALGELKLDFPKLEGGSNPAWTIMQYEKLLLGFPKYLARFGLEEKFLAQIEERAHGQYLPLLRNARAQVRKVTLKQTPQQNVETLKSVAKECEALSPTFVGQILARLDVARTMADKISALENRDQMFELLFELWELEEFRANFKAQKGAIQYLYKFFEEMTPEQMAWLREQNKDIMTIRMESWWNRRWHDFKLLMTSITGWWGVKVIFSEDPIQLLVKMEQAKVAISIKGVEDIKSMMLGAINLALIDGFDMELRSNSRLLINTMLNTVRVNIDGIKQDPKTFLRKEGIEQVRIWLFDKKPHYVAVESANAKLMMAQNRFVTVLDDTQSKSTLSQLPKGAIVTNAQTLGRSLSLQAKRLKILDQDPRVNKGEVGYWEEVFTPLNKLMAIGGFRYMEDGPRFTAFLRKVRGPRGDYDMDIFNYKDEKGIFSVPDRLFVTKDFTLASEVTRSSGVTASVHGIAEMLRGASSLMSYFRDWVKNGFDENLGARTYKGIQIFPKSSFYALGLGVAAVPLLNLTRDGFVGYGNSKTLYEAPLLAPPVDERPTMECPLFEGVPGADNKIDPVIAVALTALTSQGRGDIVRSADIARFILAADQFVESTEGVENTSARPLIKEEDGFKSVMKQILCGRKSVRTLMIGLSNFLTSRMQTVDGGFVRAYSLSEKRIVPDPKEQMTGEGMTPEGRYLEDQLLVLQALSKVYSQWRGEAYRHIAVDTYHFLNAKMFDKNTGFYKKIESALASQSADLRLMTLALKTFDSIEKLLPPEDFEQFEFIRSQWRRQVREFAHSLAN